MAGFPRWMGYVLSCVSRDRLLPTLCVVTETAEAVPPISPKALSDALAALGAYAEPPTDAQLAAAERAEGRAGSPAGQRPVRLGASARDDRRGRRGAGRGGRRVPRRCMAGGRRDQ